jgi:surfeit locus 1 family protein
VRALSSALDRVPRYQRVEVAGRYDPEHQILLDNITLNGAVGYFVLTPLRRSDGAQLLVNRGWVRQSPIRSELPEISVGAGTRTVRGRVDELPRAGIHLAAPDLAGWPRVMNFPDSAEIAAVLGGRVYPQILLLDPVEPDGFRREWHPPGLGPLRHVAYAVQWFALALTAVILGVVLSLRPAGETP